MRRTSRWSQRLLHYRRSQRGMMMCTDEKDIEELDETKGALVLVYTPSPVARTFLRVHTLRVHFAHSLMRGTHMHGSRSWKSCLPCACRLLLISLSPFSWFTRLRLLFLHGHFETITDALIHTILPNFPELKSAGQAHPMHEGEQFGYLAKSVLLTGYEPKEIDKNTSVDDDAKALINDLDHNISRLLENHAARTLVNSVFTQCLNPLFCTSLIGDFVRQREKAKKALQSGNRCKTERDEREGFVISVADSMPMKSRRNSIRSHSLQTHRGVRFWWTRSPRTPRTKSSTSYSW